MSTIEQRLEDLERKSAPGFVSCLWICHDTTFEQAKAQFEERYKRQVTDDEFKAALPNIPKFIWDNIVGPGETRENPWIGEYIHEEPEGSTEGA